MITYTMNIFIHIYIYICYIVCTTKVHQQLVQELPPDATSFAEAMNACGDNGKWDFALVAWLMAPATHRMHFLTGLSATLRAPTLRAEEIMKQMQVESAGIFIGNAGIVQ